MGEAANSYSVPVSRQNGGHDRNTVTGFGQCQQCMRRAALHENGGLEAGKPAGGIECLARSEAAIEKEERLRLEVSNVHVLGLSKLKRPVADRNELDRRQQEGLEGMIVGLKRMQRANADVELPALQHCQQRGTERFGQSDLYMRTLRGVAMQEMREDAVDHLRRRPHLQDPCIGPQQHLSSLAKRVHGTKDGAAFTEQQLASTSEDQPTANAVEQSDAELRFERANLARECGLCDPQTKRCLGDSPLFGNRNEGSQMTKVHAATLCLPGMNF